MPNNTHEYGQTVEGVEIFALGNWTDSQGFEREWTESDLNKLLKNFRDDSKDHPIPVKVGHTDDTFNNRVADELGIPNSLLTGDDGMGAARLGQISEVRKQGDKLVADFDNVPDPITDMIQEGMFNAVSVEIDMPDDDDPHLSGVAILGAEMPAVESLRGLDEAKVFAHMAKEPKPWVTLTFQDGEPEQIDPEELAAEFRDISDKMEGLIKGKKGARLLRAFWSEIKRRMSDVTGKQFSAFSSGNWEAIIEAQKNSTLTLPLEVVAKLCPDCGAEMGAAGLSKLKIKNFELNSRLKEALMNLGGEPDEGYFGRLMSLDIGVEGGDKLALCAMLTKEKTGKWPILTDGGDDNREHSNEDSEDFADAEYQPPPQLVQWATGVSFDECVRQLSEPGKGIPDPDALCASLKRAGGELQAETGDTEVTMNEHKFVGLLENPEQAAQLLEMLGLPPDASSEQVMEAIRALVGGNSSDMPDGEGSEAPPMEMPMSEEKDSKIAELEAQIQELKGFNKNLQHERLVMAYTKQAEGWRCIGGDPNEIGKELAEIHENAGEKVAQKVVAQYQHTNNVAEEAGVLHALGTSRGAEGETGAPDDFEEEVANYAKENGMTFERALGVFAARSDKKADYQAYKMRVRESVYGGK